MNPKSMGRLLTAVLLINFCSTAAAADVATIGWSDLIDEAAQTYQDPYRDLTTDQFRRFQTVVLTRRDLGAPSLTAETRSELEAKLEVAEAALTADGIDIDWLISQRWPVVERRERAAAAGNPAVDGQSVTLSGFAINVPPDEDGTAIVYLVPERGMCSHMPPPHPNQMLRVRLTGDWRPRYMHEPVKITGRLSIDPSEQVFFIVDGPVTMNATFRMQAEEVATVGPMSAFNAPLAVDPLAVNKRAAVIAERLRDAGQLLSPQSTETE